VSQERSQKLSEARMESIQPEDRMFYVWDSEVRGFGVRVMPSGTKTFVSKIYITGKQIWQTLGAWSKKNTVAKARAAAEAQRGRKAEGENPKPKRLKAELWKKVVDQFEEELLDQKKPKTAENYRSILRAHIRPAFEKKLVSEISSEDVRAFFKGMADKPRQANVCMGLLKRIFDRAEAKEHIPINSNPVDLLRKTGHKNNPERSGPPLDDEELLRLGRRSKFFNRVNGIPIFCRDREGASSHPGPGCGKCLASAGIRSIWWIGQFGGPTRRPERPPNRSTMRCSRPFLPSLESKVPHGCFRAPRAPAGTSRTSSDPGRCSCERLGSPT